mmetsp:Transcript_114782/g.305157  ORF Transcript_114782/g.305157 Transcript_114782/m.305157 type:complete len:480 (-) Transcript_114782:2-1441(-)
MEPVDGEVAQEAQGLEDDVDIFERSAPGERELVLVDALERVLDVLQPAPSHGQEGHVADAKAAALHDGGLHLLLAAVHRKVVPGVPEAAEPVHRLEEVEEHARRHRDDALMHEPAGHAGARQVLPPCQQVDLLAPVLDARPRVLHGKGAIAEDASAAILQVVVGRVVVHAVAHAALEALLARVLDDAIPSHAPGVVVYNRGVELLHQGAVRLPLRHEGQHVLAVDRLLVANDVQLDDVGPEAEVRLDPVLLGRPLEVLQHLRLVGPDAPTLRVGDPIAQELSARPHVEGRQLRLQPRGLVRGGDPAVAADNVVAVKAHDVAVAVLHVGHRRLEAVVPCTDDADRCVPHVRLGREALDASHNRLGCYLVQVVLLGHVAPSPVEEFYGVDAHHAPLGQHLLHLPNFCADHAGQVDDLVAIHDLQLTSTSGHTLVAALGHGGNVLAHAHHGWKSSRRAEGTRAGTRGGAYRTVAAPTCDPSA